MSIIVYILIIHIYIVCMCICMYTYRQYVCVSILFDYKNCSSMAKTDMLCYIHTLKQNQTIS